MGTNCFPTTASCLWLLAGRDPFRVCYCAPAGPNSVCEVGPLVGVRNRHCQWHLVKSTSGGTLNSMGCHPTFSESVVCWHLPSWRMVVSLH